MPKHHTHQTVQTDCNTANATLKRKKQPEAMRSLIIDFAGRLAAEYGPAALTLDRVARESGVSKGGLLHHFPSKNALLMALFEDCLTKIEAEMQALAQSDQDGPGRSVRAYVRVIEQHRNDTSSRVWSILSTLMLFDPDLRARYNLWVSSAPIEEYTGDIQRVDLAIVRLAADGLWIADLLDNGDTIFGTTRAKLVERLIELTRTRVKCEPGRE